jgi:hypothetical protein
MLERLRRLISRGRNPDQIREDEENRLRAQQELRQAEQRKTEDQRGLEGTQQGLPFGRP